jgi:type IV secretion system protein VirB9
MLAARKVDASDAPGAVPPLTTYTYGDRALFSVATAPLRVTDIALQPGEKLVAHPTAGDSSRWVLSVLSSVVHGEPQQHVFIKPLRAGLRTNLTLTTSRRSYFLELTSRDDGTYMASVQWTYPRDAAEQRRQELARIERERQSSTQISDLNALRFDYRIEVWAGAPQWKPTQVFDDGKKTFIRFPRPVSTTRAPVLFVLQSGSTEQAKYVNYRIKGDLYVIERRIDTAELRLATPASAASRGRQEIVRIIRQ